MEQKSEFNDAIGHLNRMNISLQIMGMHKRDKNARGWFDELTIFYTELSNNIKGNDFIELEKQRKEIAKHINGSKKLQIGIMTFDLFEKLLDFEIKLRKIYSKSGYEDKYSEDPRRAIR